MDRLTATSFAALALAGGLHAQERPNIILFLVDDMGLMDTSVPFITDRDGRPVRQPLNDWYRTPNMERLAAQGIRFSTFYAQSVSSPSRASIMTGQNAARHRTTNWINRDSNNRNKFGPYEWNWKGLKPEDQCYPALLKAAGYRTIHIGKAHFGCGHSIAENPIHLGFDVNIGGCAIGHPGSYYGEYGYGHLKGNRGQAVPDLEKYHGTSTFLSDALTIEACAQMEACVKDGVPFYLNMAHYAVHAPFETDPRFIAHYPDDGKKGKRACAFATLIEGMDKSLGDILDKLETLGVAENTLVIFLGDNGGDAPLGGPEEHACCAPLRGKKGAEYEGGSRVPFIAAWAGPDKENKFQQAFPIAENAVQTQMATIMDLYPTVLSAAGVKVPENHILDGSDLRRLLTGKADRRHRDDFLLHFPHEHRGSYFTAYRKGDWKLIYYYHPENGGTPSCKLYHLTTDPYENEDLAAARPRLVTRLCRQMIARLRKEKAVYPVNGEGKTLYPVVL